MSGGRTTAAVAGAFPSAQIFYEDLVAARDRLAGLTMPRQRDFDVAGLALNEAVFFLLTPPAGVKTSLRLPSDLKTQLRGAAASEAAQLLAMTTALAAVSLVQRAEGDSLRDVLENIREGLDSLVFDFPLPKRKLLSALGEVRSEIQARSAYLRSRSKSGFRFPQMPETYAARKSKAERPDQFFNRVYARFVPKGLTQADIRNADPAYYNVLHAWCSRHKKRLSGLVPASRSRRG